MRCWTCNRDWPVELFMKGQWPTCAWCKLDRAVTLRDWVLNRYRQLLERRGKSLGNSNRSLPPNSHPEELVLKLYALVRVYGLSVRKSSVIIKMMSENAGVGVYHRRIRNNLEYWSSKWQEVSDPKSFFGFDPKEKVRETKSNRSSRGFRSTRYQRKTPVDKGSRGPRFLSAGHTK